MSQSAILTETEFPLDGDLSELSRATDEVARFCRASHLDESVEFNLNLIVEELFVNAVSHGGCRGMSRAASIRLSREPDGAVALTFADRGKPFDPAAAPAPNLTAPLEERSPGGLGLHFVRSLAQIVDYRREDGWNHLTLRLEDSL